MREKFKAFMYCLSYCTVGMMFKLIVGMCGSSPGTIAHRYCRRRGVNYIAFRLILRRLERFDKSTHAVMLYLPFTMLLLIVFVSLKG